MLKPGAYQLSNLQWDRVFHLLGYGVVAVGARPAQSIAGRDRQLHHRLHRERRTNLPDQRPFR
jgi:hypothetical protein